MKVLFRVWTSHTHPDYRFDGLEVEARASGGTHDGVSWTAYERKLGCSKYADTPERAVRLLLNDHACLITKMERADEQPKPEPITCGVWSLVDAKTGAPICEGDERESFRGERAKITGGQAPQQAFGKEGYISTAEGQFYPSVYGARWKSL